MKTSSMKTVSKSHDARAYAVIASGRVGKARGSSSSAVAGRAFSIAVSDQDLFASDELELDDDAQDRYDPDLEWELECGNALDDHDIAMEFAQRAQE